MGKNRNAYRVPMNKPEGIDYLEDLGRGGRIMLKWILKT
jgi:hypothetical protein